MIGVNALIFAMINTDYNGQVRIYSPKNIQISLVDSYYQFGEETKWSARRIFITNIYIIGFERPSLFEKVATHVPKRKIK